MASPAQLLDFPRELLPVAQELRKTIRLSRAGNPRVITWFNLNSRREHYYILKKGLDYEVYGHFYSRAELARWCERYHFDVVDFTEVTYESTTKTLDQFKNGL